MKFAKFPVYSETAWFEWDNLFQWKTTKSHQSFDYLIAINAESAGVFANKAAVMKL